MSECLKRRKRMGDRLILLSIKFNKEGDFQMSGITLEQMETLCLQKILYHEKEVLEILQEHNFLNVDQFLSKEVKAFVSEFIKTAEYVTECFDKGELPGEDDRVKYMNILYPREPKSWPASIKTILPEDVCNRLLIEIQIFCIYPFYWLISNNYGENAIMFFVHGLCEFYYRELGWSKVNVDNYHNLLWERIQEYYSAISKAEDGVGLSKVGKLASKNILGEDWDPLVRANLTLHIVAVMTSFKPVFEKYKLTEQT